MKVWQLEKKLNLTPLSVCEEGLSAEVSGCYVGDLLSWVMGKAQKGDAWVTIMTNLNVAAVASLIELPMVIIAEGCAPDENLVQRAQAAGVCLFGSSKSSYGIACEIYEAFKAEASTAD
jgi:hypothetical protein